MTPMVLNYALASKEVKELPMMKELADPYQWLSESLLVKFPDDGEVMSIELEPGTANHRSS